MKKATTIILMTMLLSGCGGLRLISDKDGVWVSERRPFFDDKIFLCEPNKIPETGQLRPRCYEANMIDMRDRLAIKAKASEKVDTMFRDNPEPR